MVLTGTRLQAQESAAGSPMEASNIRVERNIRYGKPPHAGIKDTYYLLDLYSPGKINKPLPLIIMMHGGGFKLGSKKSNSTPVFARSFAEQGFICASINYRLSKKKPLSKFTDLAEGCYEAISDLQQAIAFLKERSGEYQIDTSRIILAGNSAGGMMALQAVYSSPALLVPLFDSTAHQTLSTEPFLRNISAVVNCWGGIYDSVWMKNASVRVISIHGSRDRVVPIEYADSTVFGSAVIHRQLNRLDVPNQLKLFDGIGHELAKPFNPFWNGPASKKRCREASVIIAEFLSRQIKP